MKEQEGLKYGIIEVTTKCQLRCPGCYMVERKALNSSQMTLDQAIEVLNLCKGYLGRELETMDILGGEPLLWPHLEDFIEELIRRGITPWIFTNMLAINSELAAWLYEREVHITGKLNIDPTNIGLLSVQAMMIGSSEKMARRMIDAIQIFMDAGYKDPFFKIENLVRKSNLSLVPAFYRWCLERNIGADVELMGCGEGITEEYWELAPRPAEIAQMILKIQKVRSDFGLEDAEILMPHVFSSCRFFDSGLYFAVDGSIRPCSNSAVVLGNINDPDAIRSAWESELFCYRRALTREKMGNPCGSCDKWEKCRGGCRATVEGSGDPFGAYSLCPLPFM